MNHVQAHSRVLQQCVAYWNIGEEIGIEQFH